MPSSTSPTQHMVALLVVSVYAGLVGVLSFHSVPGENKEALEIVLGVLGSAFGGVIGFYFGSSTASRASTDALAAVAAGTGTGTVPIATVKENTDGK